MKEQDISVVDGSSTHEKLRQRKCRKKDWLTILLVLLFVIGLCVLLYPAISNCWNSFRQTRAIASYVSSVEQLDEKAYEEMWEDAVAYNDSLLHRDYRWAMSAEEKKEYNSLLDIDGNGMIGYVEIPTIHVSLPIYHGTSEDVLQIAAGHLAGSSLPIGGENTHCVISGHCGLPSAQLFSNLDRLKEGNLFVIRVLDETLTYEVDQIRIVDPDDMSDLKIEEGKDLCTLLTCTPYGVNTHRLLVRGHRISNQGADPVQMAADVQQSGWRVAAVVITLLLFIFLVLLLVKKKKER